MFCLLLICNQRYYKNSQRSYFIPIVFTYTCMYTYICSCTCVHTLNMYNGKDTYVYKHVYIYTNTHTYNVKVQLCVHVHPGMHTCTQKNTYVYISIYLYVHTCTEMFTLRVYCKPSSSTENIFICCTS